jgi:hypothetical protein
MQSETDSEARPPGFPRVARGASEDSEESEDGACKEIWKLGCKSVNV